MRKVFIVTNESHTAHVFCATQEALDLWTEQLADPDVEEGYLVDLDTLTVEKVK